MVWRQIHEENVYDVRRFVRRWRDDGICDVRREGTLVGEQKNGWLHLPFLSQLIDVVIGGCMLQEDIREIVFLKNDLYQTQKHFRLCENQNVIIFGA